MKKGKERTRGKERKGIGKNWRGRKEEERKRGREEVPKRGREKRGVEEDLEDFLRGPINPCLLFNEKGQKGDKRRKKGREPKRRKG